MLITIIIIIIIIIIIQTITIIIIIITIKKLFWTCTRLGFVKLLLKGKRVLKFLYFL